MRKNLVISNIKTKQDFFDACEYLGTTQWHSGKPITDNVSMDSVIRGNKCIRMCPIDNTIGRSPETFYKKINVKILDWEKYKKIEEILK